MSYYLIGIKLFVFVSQDLTRSIYSGLEASYHAAQAQQTDSCSDENSRWSLKDPCFLLHSFHFELP